MRPAREDPQRRYRQGLLLGFTLSEVMILLVAALLLSLGVGIGKVAQDLRKFRKEAEECQTALNVVPDCPQQLAEVRRVLNGSAGEIDDLFNELRLVTERAEKWKKVAAALPGLSEAEVANKVGRLKPSPRSEDGPDYAAKLAACEQRLTDTEKQATYWMEKAKTIAGRGGLDYPPCWRDTRDSIVYLFDIQIGDEGLNVRDIVPDDRRPDIEKFALEPGLFTERQSAAEFERRTRSIAADAKQNNCRHYVRVYDRTTTKEAYKSQLRAIERHFYKLER